MDFREALREEAQRFALMATSRAITIKNEIATLDAKKAGLEAKLSELAEVPQLLKTYEPQRGNVIWCPRCHVERGRPAELRGIPSQTKDDIMRCRECDTDFVIPND